MGGLTHINPKNQLEFLNLIATEISSALFGSNMQHLYMSVLSLHACSQLAFLPFTKKFFFCGYPYKKNLKI